MDLVKLMPGCCVNDICGHFSMSRIGVMKHIQLLVEARLLISRKKGRTREFFFNAAPIQMIYDRWTDEYSTFWTTQAVDLKYAVESKSKTANTKTTNATSARNAPPTPPQENSHRNQTESQTQIESSQMNAKPNTTTQVTLKQRDSP